MAYINGGAVNSEVLIAMMLAVTVAGDLWLSFTHTEENTVKREFGLLVIGLELGLLLYLAWLIW